MNIQIYVALMIFYHSVNIVTDNSVLQGFNSRLILLHNIIIVIANTVPINSPCSLHLHAETH